MAKVSWILMILYSSQFTEVISPHALFVDTTRHQLIFCYIPGAELIKKLWIPQLIFTNNLRLASLEVDDYSSLTIKRMGEPLLTGDTVIIENHLFNGAENQLQYNDTYELEFHCDFNLENYPFDFQVCFIKVKLGFYKFYPRCGEHY